MTTRSFNMAESSGPVADEPAMTRAGRHCPADSSKTWTTLLAATSRRNVRSLRWRDRPGHVPGPLAVTAVVAAHPRDARDHGRDRHEEHEGENFHRSVLVV